MDDQVRAEQQIYYRNENYHQQRKPIEMQCANSLHHKIGVDADDDDAQKGSYHLILPAKINGHMSSHVSLLNTCKFAMKTIVMTVMLALLAKQVET